MRCNLHHVQLPHRYFFLDCQRNHVDQLANGKSAGYLPSENNAGSIRKNQLNSHFADAGERAQMAVRGDGCR